MRIRLLIVTFVLMMAGVVQAQDADAPVLRVACPPNPNAIPLFVALDQIDPALLQVEFLPVPGVPELADAVRAGEVDALLFFSAAGAKLHNADTLPDLRLHSVNVWRALYLLADAEAGIESLADLAGARILASFPGGAPDLTLRAVMRDQGYDPDADFEIVYMPGPQVSQLIVAGQGDAALLPEPNITQTIRRAAQDDIDLVPVVDLQAGFGSDSWDEGTAPLGALFALQATLDDPNLSAAFELFAAAYADASVYVMENPEDAAPIISAGFDTYFGATLPEAVIVDVLTEQRLLFESRPVSALRPDLDDFLAFVVGDAPDETFYINTEPPDDDE